MNDFEEPAAGALCEISAVVSTPDSFEMNGSEILGARLWRLPPKSANTLHKHVRAEEFYFVLEGTGRIRVADETLTVPRYGAVLVGPSVLRQVFNDTDNHEPQLPRH